MQQAIWDRLWFERVLQELPPLRQTRRGPDRIAIGKPGRKPKGNRRWFAFWVSTGSMGKTLVEYSGDPEAPEKVRAMPLAEQLKYAEQIGLIVDDGTGIHPVW